MAKDLRSFVKLLEEHGELKRVSLEVDPNLEIGAVTRLGLERRAAAMLFENVRGKPGQRVLANYLGGTKPLPWGRVALAMGLPKDTSSRELIDRFGEALLNRVKPVVVDSAPCKEVILRGDDVDLSRFPILTIHGTDGGPYFGTAHIDVIKDPDTGWTNWGTYRHMYLGPRQLAWRANRVQHGAGLYFNKYEPRGLNMPVAIAIGTDPISYISAGTGVPAQVDEAELAGALIGEPFPVVKCETLDLFVPATAEIVLEGYVKPGERVEEGPFGEFTGYCGGGVQMQPVFNVTCITHRRDPIFTMSNVGKGMEDCDTHQSISLSAALANELRARGIPFKEVYMPIAPPIAIAISVKPQYPGFAHTIASAVWGSKAAMNCPTLFVVDEDVDVTNHEDVLWALVTRCHPERGIHIQKNTPCSTLWPFLNAAERRASIGARVFFDATFPYGLPKEERPTVIDFEHGWPEDVQRQALEKWKALGFE